MAMLDPFKRAKIETSPGLQSVKPQPEAEIFQNKNFEEAIGLVNDQKPT